MPGAKALCALSKTRSHPQTRMRASRVISTLHSGAARANWACCARDVPDAFGGAGRLPAREAVVHEELARRGLLSLNTGVHSIGGSRLS
jgi:alkylation response protein AidB-like acyl-CoA dehydrogenase